MKNVIKINFKMQVFILHLNFENCLKGIKTGKIKVFPWSEGDRFVEEMVRIISWFWRLPTTPEILNRVLKCDRWGGLKISGTVLPKRIVTSNLQFYFLSDLIKIDVPEIVRCPKSKNNNFIIYFDGLTRTENPDLCIIWVLL